MTIHDEVEADLAQIAPRDVNPFPYNGLDGYTSNYTWGGDSKEPLSTHVRTKGLHGVGLVHHRVCPSSLRRDEDSEPVIYAPPQHSFPLWQFVRVSVPLDPGVRLVFENTVERFKQ